MPFKVNQMFIGWFSRHIFAKNVIDFAELKDSRLPWFWSHSKKKYWHNFDVVVVLNTAGSLTFSCQNSWEHLFQIWKSNQKCNQMLLVTLFWESNWNSYTITFAKV